jgi:hypothetical protein
MSRSPSDIPPPEAGLLFHLRLCAGDPDAPADVCRAYLDPVLDHLAARYPRLDPHLRQTAAHEALLGYFKDPRQYVPERADLGLFLRMAARRDLQNLIEREDRHHRREIPWTAVEEGDGSRNLSGEKAEATPVDEFERCEQAKRWHAYLESLAATFSAEERCVWDLMLAGERSVTAFATVLGLTDRSAEEQAREVKRIKDRIKARIKRGGWTDE